MDVVELGVEYYVNSMLTDYNLVRIQLEIQLLGKTCRLIAFVG